AFHIVISVAQVKVSGRFSNLKLQFTNYNCSSMPPANQLTRSGAINPPESESAPTVNVFAIHGAEPEVQAYAMAKYSRSALSMKESLREISEQKAEQFLNTFYFQYGHRSIADLAHVSFAIEKLSLLAAITLVDE